METVGCWKDWSRWTTWSQSVFGRLTGRTRIRGEHVIQFQYPGGWQACHPLSRCSIVCFYVGKQVEISVRSIISSAAGNFPITSTRNSQSMAVRCNKYLRAASSKIQSRGLQTCGIVKATSLVGIWLARHSHAFSFLFLLFLHSGLKKLSRCCRAHFALGDPFPSCLHLVWILHFLFWYGKMSGHRWHNNNRSNHFQSSLQPRRQDQREHYVVHHSTYWCLWTLIERPLFLGPWLCHMYVRTLNPLSMHTVNQSDRGISPNTQHSTSLNSFWLSSGRSVSQRADLHTLRLHMLRSSLLAFTHHLWSLTIKAGG